MVSLTLGKEIMDTNYFLEAHLNPVIKDTWNDGDQIIIIDDATKAESPFFLEDLNSLKIIGISKPGRGKGETGNWRYDVGIARQKE
jgi:hypothetical protein